MPKLYKSKFLIFIISLLSFFSCEEFRGRFPSGPIESPFGFQQGQTGIRFINLCAKSNKLDFVVATKKIVSNATYKFAGAIFNVGTGTRSIQIKPAANPTQNLADFSLNVDQSKIYTVLAYNKFDDFKFTVIEHTPKQVSSGKSLVRFFHGTKDIAGTIDIKIQNEKGVKVVQGLGFGGISNFIEVDAGRNDIIVTITGTNNIILTVVSFLESSKVYSGFITGLHNETNDEKININFLNESDSRAQVLFNFESGEAIIRFLNASSDSPNLDFHVDQVKVLTDQPFKLASSILRIKAGSRNIKIFESGGIVPVFSGSFNFELDKSYMFVAINNFANLSGLLFETPKKIPPGDRSALRVVHVSAVAPTVYIKFTTTRNLPPSYITLSFRGVSNYLEFPAGPLDVVIYRAGTSDTLKYGRMFVDGGKVYTAYLLNYISGTQSEPVTFDLLIDSEPGSQMLFNWF